MLRDPNESHFRPLRVFLNPALGAKECEVLELQTILHEYAVHGSTGVDKVFHEEIDGGHDSEFELRADLITEKSGIKVYVRFPEEQGEVLERWMRAGRIVVVSSSSVQSLRGSLASLSFLERSSASYSFIIGVRPSSSSVHSLRGSLASLIFSWKDRHLALVHRLSFVLFVLTRKLLPSTFVMLSQRQSLDRDSKKTISILMFAVPYKPEWNNSHWLRYWKKIRAEAAGEPPKKSTGKALIAFAEGAKKKLYQWCSRPWPRKASGFGTDAESSAESSDEEEERGKAQRAKRYTKSPTRKSTGRKRKGKKSASKN